MNQLPSFVSFWTHGELAEEPRICDRFSSCFAAAWKQIPEADRKRLRVCLNEPGSKLSVQLVDDHPSLHEGPTPSAAAQFIHDDLAPPELIFRSNYMKNASERVCRYIIAHELGHWFLKTGNPSHGKVYADAENEVSDLLVGRWGFSNEDEEEWQKERILIQAGVFVDGNFKKTLT